MAEKTLIQTVKEFFGMSAQQMVREWKMLSEEDKEQIREGLMNGSLTY